MTRPQVFTFVTNQKLAWILQLGSCLFWVSSFVYPNQHKMHPLQTNWSRAIIGVILNYLLMRYYSGSIQLKAKQTFFKASYRCITNTFQGMIFALLMFYLPMPIIHTITASSTVFTAAIQHLFYSVHLSKRSQILIIVSVLGVMLTANGQFIWKYLVGKQNQQRQSNFTGYQHVTMSQSIIISFLFICFVVIWSCGLVMIKYVKMAHYQLNLYNNIIHVIITGLAYFLIPSQKKSSFQVLLLSIPYSGLLVFFAQLCFVSSLMLCKSVGIMMILNTTSIFIAYMYSIIRYNQNVDILSAIGMIITVACIILVVSDRYS